MIDRSVFFDAVRARPFGGRLTAGQVDGLTFYGAKVGDFWSAEGSLWMMRQYPTKLNAYLQRRKIMSSLKPVAVPQWRLASLGIATCPQESK